MAARARAFAPLALAALSAAAGLALGRVFDSGRYVAAVLAAAVLPHALGVLARRLRWPAWATAALVVGGLAGFVVWALVPSTTWFGVPTGTTIDTIGRELRGGWHVLRTAAAPAPVTDGTRLLAVLVTWTVAGVADWFAFRRNATLAAVAPALVLFVWACTLGTSGSELLTVGAFTLTAAAFLALQNVAVLDRRRSWLAASQPARAHWIVPAVVIGLAALVVGVALAPAVPGADRDPLIDLAKSGPRHNGGSNYNTSVPPLLDVGAKLRRGDNVELFTVSSPQPDYWRLVALDDFSASGGPAQWTLSAKGSDEVHSDLPTEGPSGSLRQEFTIGPLGERWMPAAYRPVAVSTPALQVVSSGTLVTDHDTVKGLRYSVDSELAPTRDEVTPKQQAATARPVPSDVRKFTELPADLPPEIGATARQVVDDAGAMTPYAQAEALRDYFWTNYTYDLTVDLADDTDAITTFLHDRRGFCVQFASTYAVMARSLGIPARVAVGFTPGTVADGEYTVRAHDAHAWPEIYLSGLGWTHLFDPTPPANGVAAGGSHLPGDPATNPIASPSPVATTAVPGSSSTTSPGHGTSEGGTPATTRAPQTPRVSAANPGGGSPLWLVALVIVALGTGLALAYLAVVAVAKSRRRARRRHVSDPGVAVQGAWDEALDRLREANVPPDPALTPLELAQTPPRFGATAATRPLRALARSYTVVRYGDRAPTADDAEQAWESFDQLDRALDANLSRRERWRRRLDPSTLRAPARR